jgi:ligand-binding sensor domain-containing protein
MRIERFVRSGICICLYALAAAGLAQAQYRFKSWTTDTGLPQNTVYDIRQTRDGYLWLSTFDGLVRFDGVRFTVFNKGNTQGISSNRFLSFYEDMRGDLWAGTEDGGVVRYHECHFTSYVSCLMCASTPQCHSSTVKSRLLRLVALNALVQC